MAAGAGARMGYKPKSLLQLDGVPLISRMLDHLSQVGVKELIVVLGHHHQRIEPYVQSALAKVVIHPSPDDGQVSSQRLGLAALALEHDAIIMALADQPLLDKEDLQVLLDRFEKRAQHTEMLYPQVNGSPANPVIITSRVRKEIGLREPSYGCRQWRAEHPQSVERFLSDNTHFSWDLDTPEDVLALMKNTGRDLSWGPEL